MFHASSSRNGGDRRIAFSFVELILAMVVLTLLVSIGISEWGVYQNRSRHDIAVQKLKTISDAIQRYQLEHNTAKYPYPDITPLVGTYIEQDEADPWGNEYLVNTQTGAVYSCGGDGVDNGGEGDDVVAYYQAQRDAAPNPVKSLQARQSQTTITLNWVPPTRNEDGSEIELDGSNVPLPEHIDGYAVYFRTARELDWHLLEAAVPADAQDYTTNITTWASKDETHYFVVKAFDQALHYSAASNQAGIFLSQKTDPVVVQFAPSNPRCPVGTPFYFTIDVSDADANIESITLSGFKWDGADTTYVWYAPGGSGDEPLQNLFHPVITFYPTFQHTMPTTYASVVLTVVDKMGGTTSTVPQMIEFVNTPPRVNSFSPGVFSISVLPDSPDPVQVDYALEIIDDEANLERVYMETRQLVKYRNPPGSATIVTTSYKYPWSGTPKEYSPAVPIAVENVSWAIPRTVEQTIEVEAWGEDACSVRSIERVALLVFAEDQTPPERTMCYLDASNPELYQESFSKWWIREPKGFLLQCQAFELESPPLTYQVKVVEGIDPTQVAFDTLQGKMSGALASTDYWYHHEDLPGTGNVIVSTTNSVLGSELTSVDGTGNPRWYYVGVRGQNAVGLTNFTTAEPRHRNTQAYENGFGVDFTPPLLNGIDIEGVQNHGVTWVSTFLNFSWSNGTDYGGSGDQPVARAGMKYRYRVYQTTATSPDKLIVRDWTTSYSQQISNVSIWPADSSSCVVECMVRDKAGNWSVTTDTAWAAVDLSPPVSGAMPIIDNAVVGILPTNTTVLGSWAGSFNDLESGVQSYEWGVCTTTTLPPGVAPDIYGWINANLSLTGSVSQPHLTAEGDTVYLVVRARNFAGSTSGNLYSSGALVQSSIFLYGTAKPEEGTLPLSVDVSIVVSGGESPFDYDYRFRSVESGGSDQIIHPDKASRTDTANFTYTDAEGDAPGKVVCRVVVTDNQGLATGVDVPIFIYDDFYVVTFGGKTNNTGAGAHVWPLSNFNVRKNNQYYRIAGGSADFGDTKDLVDAEVSKNGIFFVAASEERIWHQGFWGTHLWRASEPGHTGAAKEKIAQLVLSPKNNFVVLACDEKYDYSLKGFLRRSFVYPGTGRHTSTYKDSDVSTKDRILRGLAVNQRGYAGVCHSSQTKKFHYMDLSELTPTLFQSPSITGHETDLTNGEPEKATRCVIRAADNLFIAVQDKKQTKDLYIGDLECALTMAGHGTGVEEWNFLAVHPRLSVAYVGKYDSAGAIYRNPFSAAPSVICTTAKGDKLRDVGVSPDGKYLLTLSATGNNYYLERHAIKSDGTIGNNGGLTYLSRLATFTADTKPMRIQSLRPPDRGRPAIQTILDANYKDPGSTISSRPPRAGAATIWGINMRADRVQALVVGGVDVTASVQGPQADPVPEDSQVNVTGNFTSNNMNRMQFTMPTAVQLGGPSVTSNIPVTLTLGYGSIGHTEFTTTFVIPDVN